MKSKGVIIMTSDLAHIVPHSRPNIPPLDYISEGIFVGTSEFLNTPVCLSFKKLLSPTGVILGKIRTGKSTTAKSILIRQRLLYDTNILILDPHGEYVDLVRRVGGTVIDMRDQKIDPCKLGTGLTSTQKAYQLVDMLGTVFQLNLVQRAHLIDYAKRGYDERGDNLTFNYVIDMLKQESKRNSMLAKTISAILIRIGILSDSVFGDTNSIPINQISEGFVCIDLSKLENNDLRNMAMLSILQYIYNNMLASQSRQSDEPDEPDEPDKPNKNLRLLIMLDEAGRIASEESSVAVKLVKESGKFKIGLIFGIQDLPDLDPRIKSNYGFMIVHKLDDSEYISRIQKDGNFTREQAERIRSLPVGTAYLKLNFKDASVSRPFVVRVVQEEYDHEIKRTNFDSIRPKTTKIEKIRTKNEPIRKDENSPKLDNLEKENELERVLARSINDSPLYTVTQHYKNIGVDTYHGNKARESLESKGYIKGSYLKGNEKKGRILNLTEKAITDLDLKRETNRFGGNLHINIIENIANILQKQGYSVEKEKALGNNRYTDIVVNSKIAVEVDLKELRESNIRKNLDAGFERVIQICYHKKHLEGFKKKIDRLNFDNTDTKKITVVDYNTFCKQPQELLGGSNLDQ